MNNTRISNRIAELRKHHNLSQKELALKLNVSNKTVSKWECGNGIPDIEMLNNMAKIFGISLDELVNDRKSEMDKPVESQKQNSIKTRISTKKKNLFLTLSISICFLVLVSTSLLCYFFIPRKPEVLKSDIFQIDHANAILSCSVSNTTEYVSLSEAIDLPLTNDWELYTDINASNRIKSKTVNLQVGDNIFYCLIENSSGESKLYQISIRRKPIYVVSFNTDGGTAVDSIYIEEGQTIEQSTLENPSKDGYNFTGWDFNFDQKIYENTIIQAIYQTKNFKIIYHSNDGQNQTLNQTIKYSESIILLGDAFTRDYYILEGWSKQPNGQKNYSLENCISYNIPNDLILYAYWKPIQYNITYNLNGGDMYHGPRTYNVENEFTLSDPNKPGYAFTGWEEGGFIKKGSHGDKEFTATWEIAHYTIRYVLNGGKNSENNPLTYTFQDEPIVLENATREGYVFKGWYSSLSSLNLTSQISTIECSTELSNIVLCAKWYTELDETQNDDGFYIIDSKQYFYDITSNSKAMSKNYILNRSFDFNDSVFYALGSISPFTGIFDGNGYTISNFNAIIYNKNKQFDVAFSSGLFRCLNNATVKNLNIEGKDVYLPGNVMDVYGTLVDIGSGIIKNCSSSINIINKDNDRVPFMIVGGIVGQFSGTIENCLFSGTIELDFADQIITTFVGGICGILKEQSLVRGCTVSSKINVDCYDYVGGIVAQTEYTVTIENCTFTGTLNATNYNYCNNIIGFEKESK